MDARPTKVTVAMLTYQRPDDLAEVVPALLHQVGSVPLGYQADVLIVDNDASASAQASVLAHRSPLLRYVIEPEPGISAARNRALNEAAGSDLLVFIDDDERPEPDWLALMLMTWRDHGADAVAGRVVSRFVGVPDPWIAAGGFLSRSHRNGLATGAKLTDAATNNLLLDLRTVQRLGVCFDPAFGLTGGEDSLFTRTLTDRGARLVWCAEAVVTDQVPVARMKRSWVLARAMSHGNTAARVDVRLAASRSERGRRRLSALGQGMSRLGVGLGRAAVGTLARSTINQARGMRIAARGVGLILGSAGFAYQEYRRPIKEGRQSR